VTDSNQPPASPATPEPRTTRSRIVRRQEALTIGWLRSLGRSAGSSSTAPATGGDERRFSREPEDPA
jgi:hypothetical protein